MTSAGLVQHAVRRDLARAHLVLTGVPRLETERRHALARHLSWIAGLAITEDPQLRAALARLDRAARLLAASGGPQDRLRAARAVADVADLQARRDDWVRPGVLASLGRQLPWLVDGLDARSCEHVTRSLSPRHGLAPMRQRAEVYRFRTQVLWGGTPAASWPRPALATAGTGPAGP